MQQAPYLIVASDDGVEFAGTCCLHQVFRILRETLVVLVARHAVDLFALSQCVDGGAQVLGGDACIAEDAAGCGLHVEQCHEHGLDGDELIAEFLCHFHGALQHGVGRVAQVCAAALHTGQVTDFAVDHALYLCGIGTKFLENEVGDVLVFDKDSLEQVLRLHILLPGTLC